MHGQEKKRKKYQRIRCPKCNGTSRVIKSMTVDGIPGYQIRKCSTCGNVFDYDYATEAEIQYNRNWNCIKKIM